MPQLLPESILFYRIFWDLLAERNRQGLQRITMPVIRDYLELVGEEDPEVRSDVLRFIGALDEELWEYRLEQDRLRKAAEDAPKAPESKPHRPPEGS